MKNNLSASPSELRQALDLIGAQFDPETTTVDPLLVMKCCQNVNMAATDSKPLPGDVFAAGLNDKLMRAALSGLCLVVMQILNQHMQRVALQKAKQP